MTTILGYYTTCDDALCKGCYKATGGLAQWRAAGGFEGWPSPLSIKSGAEGEADTPTHCERCEALIPHRLTSEGLEYVREAYRNEAAALMGNRGGGRPCIVRAWVLEYLPSQAHIVRDWPTRDQWSPTPKENA
jgi:hypothetical protein